MSNRHPLKAALIAATAMLVAAPAAGAEVIGSGSASGDGAIAYATGTASKPSRIRVRITSSPRQSVFVAWSVECSRGTRTKSVNGRFRARTRVTRRLRVPMRRPRSCNASVSALIDRAGRVRVRLLSP